MSKPKAIEYELDSWTMNFYAKTKGRGDTSLIVSVDWVAELPSEKNAPISERFDRKSSKNSFSSLAEADKWLQEELKS